MAGTIDNPVKLSVILNGKDVLPGDVFLLRAGTYTGDFVSRINGTAENPVTLKAYPGEHAIIDGALLVSGNYTTWQDLEICYTGWTGREEVPNGVLPTQSLSLSGTGNRAIGCIIHDTAGNGSWQSNTGGGYSECLIYNCGWLSPDRGHGHAIYTQNETATQEHNNNILWGQYGFGMHAYTQGGLINNFVLQNNICFRNGGRQWGTGGLGGQRMNTSTIDGNVLYEGDGWLKGTDITLSNNYSPNGFTIDALSTNVTESGNTFTAEQTNRVFVFPLTHRTGAHIAIFNPEGLDTVTVDVSAVAGLTSYALHNAQDYYGDIVTGMTVGTISVDMRATSHTVASRIGGGSVSTTFPSFAAFVVEQMD